MLLRYCSKDQDHSFHMLISCSRVAGSKQPGFWINLYHDLSPFSFEDFKSSRAFTAWLAADAAASVARIIRRAISAPSIPVPPPTGDPGWDAGFEGWPSIAIEKRNQSMQNQTKPVVLCQQTKIANTDAPRGKQTWYTSWYLLDLCVCPPRSLRILGLRYHNSFSRAIKSLGVSSLRSGHAIHDLQLKLKHAIWVCGSIQVYIHLYGNYTNMYMGYESHGKSQLKTQNNSKTTNLLLLPFDSHQKVCHFVEQN